MRKITGSRCSRSVFVEDCPKGYGVAPVERARFVTQGGNASNARTSPLFHGITFLKGLRREEFSLHCPHSIGAEYNRRMRV